MHSSFKSFLWLLILVGALTVGAIYLPKVLQAPEPEVFEAPKTAEPEVVYDDSLPFNLENAQFNFTEDKAVQDTAMFGFISEVKIDEVTGKATIKFDQTRLYKGEEAEKQARADLGCGKAGAPVECEGVLVPTGEYITNPIKKVFEFELTPEATIKLLSFANRETGTGVKLSDASALQELISTYDITDISAGNKQFPAVWIMEENGKVSYLEQQLLK